MFSDGFDGINHDISRPLFFGYIRVAGWLIRSGCKMQGEGAVVERSPGPTSYILLK